MHKYEFNSYVSFTVISHTVKRQTYGKIILQPSRPRRITYLIREFWCLREPPNKVIYHDVEECNISPINEEVFAMLALGGRLD